MPNLQSKRATFVNLCTKTYKIGLVIVTSKPLFEELKTWIEKLKDKEERCVSVYRNLGLMLGVAMGGVQMGACLGKGLVGNLYKCRADLVIQAKIRYVGVVMEVGSLYILHVCGCL